MFTCGQRTVSKENTIFCLDLRFFLLFFFVTYLGLFDLEKFSELLVVTGDSSLIIL